MAERLTNKLEAHRNAFQKKKADGGVKDWSSWFLHMVVFPSLVDIAEKIDAIEERMAKREKKGNDEGAT